MNDIIYAGRIACGEPRKAFEVILSSEDGALEYDGGKLDYNRGDIIVIPPHFSCKRNIGAEDLYVQIDKALIALKQPKVLSDDENAGMAHAVRQAAKNGKRTRLSRRSARFWRDILPLFQICRGFRPWSKALKRTFLKISATPLTRLKTR